MSKKNKQFIAISGSLRKESFNTKLINSLQDLSPSDVQINVCTLNNIPLFNEDLEKNSIPESVLKLSKMVKNSDGIIISTPEYNSMISGVLKNALDWLSRPSVGNPVVSKPVAIMGATIGQYGTRCAQSQLKQLVVRLKMHPFSKFAMMISKAEKIFNSQGELVDEGVKGNLKKFLKEFVGFTKGLQKIP